MSNEPPAKPPAPPLEVAKNHETKAQPVVPPCEACSGDGGYQPKGEQIDWSKLKYPTTADFLDSESFDAVHSSPRQLIPRRCLMSESKTSLRPIGTEIVFETCLFRIAGHVHVSKVRDGQDIHLSADHPDARELLKPIGWVVDGEKRYFDGRRELIPDWQI